MAASFSPAYYWSGKILKQEKNPASLAKELPGRKEDIWYVANGGTGKKCKGVVETQTSERPTFTPGLGLGEKKRPNVHIFSRCILFFRLSQE